MEYKLLLTYNVKEHRAEDYYYFVMNEFLPRAQSIGLVMTEGWQTIYGDYPTRLLGFATTDLAALERAIQSDEWDSIETRLEEFISDYEKRVVQAKSGFQFFIPSYRTNRN